LKEEKVEPPEMAVFSFIGPPKILNHENKRTHNEKNQFYQRSKKVNQYEYKTMSINL